jgi:polysaccharide pyruvyl transferase WcaK-like protein
VTADADVTVVSREPKAVRALHGVTSLPMTTRSAWRLLRRTDGLIVVGGGMFGPGLPPLVRLLPAIAELAVPLRRDLAYFGIGVYPGAPRLVRAFLRPAANRGQMTVRDELSIRALDAQRKPPNIGDLAYQLQPAPSAHVASLLDLAGLRPGRPLLLIAPRAGTSDALTEQMLSAFVTAVGYWISHGGEVAAIALSAQTDDAVDPAVSDVQLAAAVAARTATRIPVLGPNLHPAVAAGLIALADAVIGLHFHAHVLAEATGTRCMGFDWGAKSSALIRELHIAAARNDQSVQNWLDET